MIPTLLCSVGGAFTGPQGNPGPRDVGHLHIPSTRWGSDSEMSLSVACSDCHWLKRADWLLAESMEPSQGITSYRLDFVIRRNGITTTAPSFLMKLRIQQNHKTKGMKNTWNILPGVAPNLQLKHSKRNIYFWLFNVEKLFLVAKGSDFSKRQETANSQAEPEFFAGKRSCHPRRGKVVH